MSIVFLFQKKSEGHILLEQVFYHLDLIEKDYFGLQYTDHHNVSVSIGPVKHFFKHKFVIISLSIS